MGLWAEAGENLLRIVPLLGPGAPPADGVDDCLPYPGCYRGVYDSSSSHTLIGAGADAGNRAVQAVRRRPHAPLAAPCRHPRRPGAARRPGVRGRRDDVAGPPALGKPPSQVACPGTYRSQPH